MRSEEHLGGWPLGWEEPWPAKRELRKVQSMVRGERRSQRREARSPPPRVDTAEACGEMEVEGVVGVGGGGSGSGWGPWG